MVTFSVATGEGEGVDMFVADLMHYTLSQISCNCVCWNNYNIITRVCLVETVTQLQVSLMKKGTLHGKKVDNREPAGLLATLHKLMQAFINAYNY